MAIHLVAAPRRLDLTYTELYNGTTSLLDFGLATIFDDVVDHTVMAYIYSTASADNKEILTKNAGARLLINDAANPGLAYRLNSTGVTDAPRRTSAANMLTANAWNLVGATAMASLTATNIHLFAGIGNRPIGNIDAGSSTTNGTGSVNVGAGISLRLGSNQAGGNLFTGSMAWVARWFGILTLAEMLGIQRAGPLSHPAGLMFCWANGRDYASNLIATTRTDVLGIGQAPMNTVLGYRRQLLPFSLPAGGSIPVMMRQYRDRRA